MRVVTFSVYGDARLGIVSGNNVVDLERACSKYSSEGMSVIFSDMRRFLGSGEAAWKLAMEVVEAAEDDKPAVSPVSTSVVIKMSQARLLAPVLNPEKIYCPAVNYRAHGAESGLIAPKKPYIFTKFAHTLVGHEGPIYYFRKYSKKMDIEAELGVIIGAGGKDIPPGKAFEHIAGYTCLNDVSYRDQQNEPGWPKVTNPYGQNWTKGKAMDNACPLGPWMVTRDEIPDPNKLKIVGRQNGKVIEQGNTSEMVHNVPKLVAYVSQGITLKPGDVIATGVPARVASVKRDYLHVGDTVEVEIEKIGVLRNHVVAV
jgi:2-keto-4-pentenoate hydratase/2-oxohepta-3-ene-1,7-dioic acid hydratase in catechol pathway